MTISLNASGTRKLDVTAEDFATIRRYNLFDGLVASHGVIDEAALERLRLTIRSLIASTEGDVRPLLNLCVNVIYHDRMKAYGLAQLIAAYRGHEEELAAQSDNIEDAAEVTETSAE